MALGAAEIAPEALEPRPDEGFVVAVDFGASSELSSDVACPVVWKTVTTTICQLSDGLPEMLLPANGIPWNWISSSISLMNPLASVGFLPQRAMGKGAIVRALELVVTRLRVSSIQGYRVYESSFLDDLI